MPFLIEQVLLLSKLSHWNALTTMIGGKVLDVLCQEHANNDSNLGQDQLLIQGHLLLHMHPLFKEKLKKGKNILGNIIKDGNQFFSHQVHIILFRRMKSQVKKLIFYMKPVV